MLSTNSLAAFSVANVTKPTGTRPIRLVRDQVPQSGAAPSPKAALPSQLPSIAPPRGSLLNLSV